MTTEDWIFNVINSFYDKARDDVLIGYHFRIIKDFNTHIPRIAAFWEIQLLGATQRKEEPFDLLKIHTPLGIKRGEVGRWMVLFKKTLNEELQKSPEFSPIQDQWLEKLAFFEKVFLRFFGL